jgi:hypothetical protein
MFPGQIITFWEKRPANTGPFFLLPVLGGFRVLINCSFGNLGEKKIGREVRRYSCRTGQADPGYLSARRRD